MIGFIGSEVSANREALPGYYALSEKSDATDHSFAGTATQQSLGASRNPGRRMDHPHVRRSRDYAEPCSFSAQLFSFVSKNCDIFSIFEPILSKNGTTLDEKWNHFSSKSGTDFVPKVGLILFHKWDRFCSKSGTLRPILPKSGHVPLSEQNQSHFWNKIGSTFGTKVVPLFV